MIARALEAGDGVPPLRRWVWWGALGVIAALFVIRLTWALAYEMAEGKGQLGSRVFDETSGAVVGLLPLIVLVVILGRNSLATGRWQRSALVLAATFAPISIVHTWVLIQVRALLGPAFGFAQYTTHASAARYVYEGATDIVHVIAIVAAFTAVELVIVRRERERRAAALERSLLESELRSLRHRLEPHFLFNALNTISATMYADVRAADVQLGHLAALLRGALRTSDVQEVSLADEVAVLAHYLALLRARFEDRLTIELALAPDALACLVPSLVLQPLVENAIRHGALERTGRAALHISAARVGGEVHLRVFDDGPGLAAGRDPLATGTGLSATVQRLRLIHGTAQRVTIDNVPGGVAVSIAMPAREPDHPVCIADGRSVAALAPATSRAGPGPAVATSRPDAAPLLTVPGAPAGERR